MTGRAQQVERVVAEDVHLRALELLAQQGSSASAQVEAALASSTVGMRASSDALVQRNTIDAEKDKRLLALIDQVAAKEAEIAKLNRQTEEFRDRQQQREAELSKLKLELDARQRMFGQMVQIALPVLAPAAKIAVTLLAIKLGVPGLEGMLGGMATGLPMGLGAMGGATPMGAPSGGAPPIVDAPFNAEPIPVTLAYADKWLAALILLLKGCTLENGARLRALLFRALTDHATEPDVQALLAAFSSQPGGEQALQDLLTFTLAARDGAASAPS
jgi:hypothetical protein